MEYSRNDSLKEANFSKGKLKLIIIIILVLFFAFGAFFYFKSKNKINTEWSAELESYIEVYNSSSDDFYESFKKIDISMMNSFEKTEETQQQIAVSKNKINNVIRDTENILSFLSSSDQNFTLSEFNLKIIEDFNSCYEERLDSLNVLSEKLVLTSTFANTYEGVFEYETEVEEFIESKDELVLLKQMTYPEAYAALEDATKKAQDVKNVLSRINLLIKGDSIEKVEQSYKDLAVGFAEMSWALEARDADKLNEASLKIKNASEIMSIEQERIGAEINKWFAKNIDEPMNEVSKRLEVISELCASTEEKIGF